MKQMDVVYIGDEFYLKSKTRLSSIYERTEDGYKRTDWGFVSVALREGKSVHISPATQAEAILFQDLLHKMSEE